MNSLRPLLRLEDKVRSETSRIAGLGESPRRRIVAISWGIALGAHAVALTLPLLDSGVELPLRTPPPDLPSVWRLAPGRPPEPAPAPRIDGQDSDPPEPIAATVPGPGGSGAEPVPEPAPVLAIRLMPTDVETLIPEPDLSERTFEPALAPRAVAPAEPRLIRSVKPTYPAAARAIAASGSVTLEVWIREDGSVEFARVISCSRPRLGFEESALLAVREWSYDSAPAGTGSRTTTVLVEFGGQAGRP